MVHHRRDDEAVDQPLDVLLVEVEYGHLVPIFLQDLDRLIDSSSLSRSDFENLISKPYIEFVDDADLKLFGLVFMHDRSIPRQCRQH